MIEFYDNYKDPDYDSPGWVLAEMDCHILKNRREELGMTQQQVADKARIQLRQYQRFESGERDLSSSSMRIGVSVCQALELDPRRFIAETFN